MIRTVPDVIENAFTQKHRSWRLSMMLGVALSATPFLGQAEVVLGATGATRTGAITVDAVDGQLKGSNLLHSFTTFNINPGESVTFTGPDAIDNVISRVTGATPSIIDGPLISTIGSADFYFINPNGILFGNNASIQVDGSFHASTADYVRLQDGGVVYANPSYKSVLTSAPPSAFGFLNANPASIYVGSPLYGPPGSKTSPGQTFSLVGGDINIGETPFGSGESYLWAQGGGRINLVSVASSGEAVFNGNGIDVSGFSQLGNIKISNGSIVDAKNVYIRSGQLVIDDGFILPGFFSLVGMDAPPNGGSVDVQVSGDITISGTQTLNVINEFRPGIATFAGLTPTPVIDPATGQPVRNPDGSVVLTLVLVNADVPDIQVSADNISVSGIAGIASDRLGPGTAGNITINANNMLEVQNGGVISLNNMFAGDGGALNISAGQVLLSGEGYTGFTGIQAQTFINPTFFVTGVGPDYTDANGASITINATDPEGLIVRAGASILGDSFSFGRSSDITINASNVSLSRDGASHGSISTQSTIAGDSGNISIHADNQLSISGGFVISGAVAGTGDGGNIDISADTINITGSNSGVFSNTAAPPEQALNDLAANFGGASWDFLMSVTGQTDFVAVLSTIADVFGFVEFNDRTPGNGGQISLAANSLSMSGDARIDSSTYWDGNGGTVQANLGSLDMSGGAQIRSRSGGISSATGDVVVGTGNGGAINLDVSGATSISGYSALSPSGISTNAFGDGNGGNISLVTSNLSMNNGATITASSTGNGLAGDIGINAGQELYMDSSLITTQATISDGGNIQISAIDKIMLDQSQITTSVESGLGGGGNIDIDPNFVILQQSTILANAYGGPGGNITIIANNFIATPDSLVDASSALGIDGTVNISSPDENVSDDLVVLPDNYLDVTGLIREKCGTTAGTSSLVDAGPGGMTVDPDGYLPIYATVTQSGEEGSGRKTSVSNGKRWWAQYIIPEGLQLADLSCSQKL